MRPGAPPKPSRYVYTGHKYLYVYIYIYVLYCVYFIYIYIYIRRMCIYIHIYMHMIYVFVFLFAVDMFKRMDVPKNLDIYIYTHTRYNFASPSQEQSAVEVELATEPGMPMDSAAWMWHVKRGRWPIYLAIPPKDRTVKSEFKVVMNYIFLGGGISIIFLCYSSCILFSSIDFESSKWQIPQSINFLIKTFLETQLITEKKTKQFIQRVAHEQLRSPIVDLFGWLGVEVITRQSSATHNRNTTLWLLWRRSFEKKNICKLIYRWLQNIANKYGRGTRVWTWLN